MQPKKEKKITDYIIPMLVIYALVILCILNYLELYNQYPNENGLTLISEALDRMMSTQLLSFSYAFNDMMELFKMIGIATAAILMIGAYYVTEEQRKEHDDMRTVKGSASFNTDYKGFAAKYTLPKNGEIKDKKGNIKPANSGSKDGKEKGKGKSSINNKERDPNIILAKGIKYGLKKGANTNVVIIGNAGSGKSFGVIKPNLMQMNSSFVITDPSGEIFHSISNMLLEDGYNVKIFSTSNMAYSHCYNPFDYCYDEEGKIDETRVSTMVTLFLQNATQTKKAGGGDPFWEKSSKALLTACAMYLLEFCPEEMHNMYQVLLLVQAGKVDENNSSSKTELDMAFEAARKKNPEAHCFSSFDTFKLAPAKTANSILISAAVDLNMFDQDRVRNLTTTDYYVLSRSAGTGQIRKYLKDADGKPIRTDKNIDLRTIGDDKTAIFVTTPQANPTYNFLVTMFYSQLFEVLYGRGESICPTKYLVRGKDGYPVLSMIDSEEDANTLIDLYKHSQIKEDMDANGNTTTYIYNNHADRKFWLPGLNNHGKLKVVYSKKVAENYLKNFEDCKVEKGGNRLPWHVQCLLDEFSNIGEIPEFPQKLATSRKYEISAMIVLQSLAQLKNRYDKLWSDVLANCMITIFLGTQDPETCKYISELLGKRTARTMTTNESNSGKGRSSGKNWGVEARELAQPDEVARLDRKKCYIIVSGEKPFLAEKAMATEHPRWEDTGDANPEYGREPKDLVICSEKKMSKLGDAYGMCEALKHGRDLKNSRGENSIKETRPKNMQEAMKDAGMRRGKSNVAGAGRSVPRESPYSGIQEEAAEEPVDNLKSRSHRYMGGV